MKTAESRTTELPLDSLSGRGATVQTVHPDLTTAGRALDFVALTRPRITSMVLMTTLTGFLLASREAINLAALCQTLLGTALAAGGASALNMFLERESDGRMVRTQGRPLPAGRLRPGEVLIFGTSTSLLGVLYLGARVNLLAASLALISILIYLFGYTPLKTKISLGTPVGAVAGALPPLIGWAGGGDVTVGGWILFGILLFWQFPHSLALGWMHKEDYARGGLRILPALDEKGLRTAAGAMGGTLGLLAVSLTPGLLRTAGTGYLIAASVLGLVLVGFAAVFCCRRTAHHSRSLFLATNGYLPLLLVLLMAQNPLAIP